MLARFEHHRVMGEQRRSAGLAASAHRGALSIERSRWKRQRQQLRGARVGHRAVLQAERDRLTAARKEHRAALRQNRWVLALVNLIEARRRRSR